MKKMKKLASLVLALAMALTLAVPVLAADETGTITIDNAVVGQTYTIYQILELESYNKEADTYSYKVAAGWGPFFASGAGATYVTITNGYVKWTADATDDGAAVKAFAKAAMEFAENNKATITPADSSTAEATKVEFTGLALGYYLVDTSLGALCSLDTTDPTAEIDEKNEVPDVEKKVKEDSTDAYVAENTAQIGDIVEFKTTIHAKKGAENYVLHDKMSAGLSLNTDSIEIKVGDTTLAQGDDYTVDYNVVHPATTDKEAYTCDFEITFTDAYLAAITGNTDIEVTYTAILNNNALIYEGVNPNETQLKYGDDNYTVWKKTETKTFKFDIVKTDADKNLLTGAKFELYDAPTDGTKIDLVKDADGVYRVATPAEKAVTGFTSAVIEAGKVTVKGIDFDDSTTYWLQETEAPEGYNKLDGRVAVEFENLTSMTATMNAGGDAWVSGGIRVINQTGAELPETGGMGTTLFYALGAVLVIGAGVAMVTKKRMA